MKNYRWAFWGITALLFFAFIFAIKAVLLPFVVGMMVAYFLDPAADWLESKGFSRTLSTAFITVIFFVVICILSFVLLPIIFNQLSELISALPSYFAELQHKYSPILQSYIDRLGENGSQKAEDFVETMATDFSGVAIGFLSGILKSSMALFNLLMLIFITPVVAFYLLHDWDVMIEKANKLLPKKHAEVIRQQFKIIDNTLSGFVRGQINVCLLLGSFYAIALSIAGLKFSIILGFAAGLLIIIPYVGTIISGISSVAIAYIQWGGDLKQVAIILAIFIVGQVVEGNFITPKLVGKKVGLHPVWIIFGMMAGGSLFGFVGILLSVPVTAVIGVLVRFSIDQYMASEMYAANDKAILLSSSAGSPKAESDDE